MKVSIQNLAQIEKADDIEIKDFNVFIGKNGTGKTYFSKLIYFLHAYKYKIRTFEKVFTKKLKDSFDKQEEVLFTIEDQKKFTTEFKNSLKNKFPEYIGSKKDLFKNFNFEINIEYNEFSINYHSDLKVFGDYQTIMGFEYFEKAFGIVQSNYLPAARANYMITYKYLFESQFNNVRDILLNKKGNRRFSILPEVENNFLSDIYKVDTKKRGCLYNLGNKIEKNIFKSGKLSIRNPKHQDLPTYEYKLNNTPQSIDLVSASSGVTELSPLIMYFRYKIEECSNELLIIDEPELSLHPEAQAKLVEILVEAVEKGLKIILVTHSPFILEALNNHLQRFKIDKYSMSNEIKKFKPINPNRVSTYLFEDHTIKNILDKDINLIDDKLLNSFNDINNVYDNMRDIEWDHNND